MSVALSNRFQGKRLMSLRCPAPDVPGSPPVRAPQHARELGGGRVVREVPLLPRRLFVSRRREGVRFAQSPAGEEARGDQSGKPRQCRDSVRVPCAALCHPFPQTKSVPSSPILGLPQLHLRPLLCGLQLQVSPFHPLALCLASPVASYNSLTREVGWMREPATGGQGLPESPLGTT